MIRIFIGYDPRESIAYHVLSHSILRRASAPVSITPLVLPQLSLIHTRPRDPLQSTDFSFTRFLVPYLCGFEGWAIYMDCDMLCMDDTAKLWALRDDFYNVMCVKHNYEPREETKFLGAAQTVYLRKNWSSLMLFNCARCTALSPDYVNSANGLRLHQFWWSQDTRNGTLPNRWNHLVDYDTPSADVAIVHYTLGGPWFDEYRNCGYADMWFNELEHMCKGEAK